MISRIRTGLWLCVAAWLFVAPAAFAASIITDSASAPAASNPKITQGRTLFPDWIGPQTVPYRITPNIFKESAVEYGRMGLFRRKACITLELDETKLSAPVKAALDDAAVVWEFSNDYYFRNMEVASDKVDVVAWAPFLAVAKVVRGDAARPVAVYADWVRPSELQLTNTGGCQ